MVIQARDPVRMSLFLRESRHVFRRGDGCRWFKVVQSCLGCFVLIGWPKQRADNDKQQDQRIVVAQHLGDLECACPDRQGA